MKELHQADRDTSEKRPEVSKYHKQVFTGRNDTGKEYIWDSLNEELEITETKVIGYKHYCVYCAMVAYPIQRRLINQYTKMESFVDHGYCCTCHKAEEEKKFNASMRALEEEFDTRKRELYKEYRHLREHDEMSLFEIEYKLKKKELQNKIRINSTML